MKKNLTLSIDEDLLQKARVLAAMQKTSVNDMIREHLEEKVKQAKVADEARSKLLALMENSTARLKDGRAPSREETYSGEPRFDRWK